MALHWMSSAEDEPGARRHVGRGAWWITVAAMVLLAFAAFIRGAEAAADRARHPRVQTGYATYYAASFHGDETASGEVFDRRKLMAAHRSLPFGTRVRVRNLENGRSVDVRIVDRGPYGQNWREGTIIDLSRAAATRLGMLKDGQVRVRVTVLRLAPPNRNS